MSSLKIAENSRRPFPALPVDVELPAHLRGSREAIFYLLSKDRAANKSLRPQCSTLPAPNLAKPTSPRKPAPALTTRSIEGRRFFQEDQFVFHVAEARNAVVRRNAVTESQIAVS